MLPGPLKKLCVAATAAAGLGLGLAAPAFGQSGDVGDPASTRRVYLIIIGLVLLAGLLTAFTIWFWRSTRPEPSSLGRLEAMSLRRWERADYADRQQQLDEVGEFEGGEGPLLEPETVDAHVEEEQLHLAELVELVEATPEPAVLPGEPLI